MAGGAGFVLPFALPALVFLLWTASRSSVDENDPLHIVATMDPDGGRTTTFSTILEDGVQAVWLCSSGTFLETGSREAPGRTVTWQPEEGDTDSVRVVCMTPSTADTVLFLPVVPDVLPSITVSPAYNLALTDRARSMQLAPGSYRVVCAGEALRGYDGLSVVVISRSDRAREVLGLLPGDTTAVSLPLGGHVEAFGIDDMEQALDNGGIVTVTFEPVLPPDTAAASSGPAGGSPGATGADTLSMPAIRPSGAPGGPAGAPFPDPPLLLPLTCDPVVSGFIDLRREAPLLDSGVLLLSGAVPDSLGFPGGAVTCAGRMADQRYEQAGAGVYYVRDDPGAVSTATRLSDALGLPAVQVNTMLTLRDDRAAEMAPLLSEPVSGSDSVAVVVEASVSVAGGASWIREYRLFVAGSDSGRDRPSGLRGAPLPGVSLRDSPGSYRVAVIPR